MTLTVRLGAKTERAVNRLARQRRQSRSQIVRDALDHYTGLTDASAAESRPYDDWVDVIGAVALGVRDAARTTGEQFTDLVLEKARARRSR